MKKMNLLLSLLAFSIFNTDAAPIQYQIGDTTTQDEGQALKYYNSVIINKNATPQQLEVAQYGLATLYTEGANKDYQQAVKYFTAVANSNPTNVGPITVSGANESLGYIYLNGGYGIQQNNTKALQYFTNVVNAPASNVTPAALASAKAGLASLNALGIK